MKSMLLKVLVLGSLGGSLAHANDGGVIGIQVKELKIEKVNTRDFEHPVRSELPLKSGDEVQMTFKGGDIPALMKLLPGGRFVATDYAKHVRTFAVAAKEGNLFISCQDADLKMDEEGGSTWTSQEPNCTISMTKYEQPADDDLITDWFGDWETLAVPKQCMMP